MQYQAQSWNSYMTSPPPSQPRSITGTTTFTGGSSSTDPWDRIQRLASENAVVIFSNSTCCMCHAVKHLFNGMGVNPTVYELDQDPRGGVKEIIEKLMCGSVPVVFIGGKLVGSMERVMASHINGSLVPLLKQAGALWL